MVNSTETLIHDIHQRGIILKVKQDRIRFHPRSRMTPELLERLHNHKTEVISKLTTPVGVTKTPKTIEKRIGFADSNCQNPPSDGISVLRPGHPFASFYHDAVFGDTAPSSIQQAGRHREWTAEEQSLIDWFNQNFGSLPTKHFQHEINLAGLQHQLCFGPGYRDARKLIADLRLLKADPERFHDFREQRHLRELNQWNPRYRGHR